MGKLFNFARLTGRNQHGGDNSRGKQQLIIGPWLHGGYPKSNKLPILQ